MTMKGTFRVNTSRIRSNLGESVGKKAERVTQKLVDQFIERSPVRTGNFRASWNVSEGFPVFKMVVDGSVAAVLGPPTILVKAKQMFPVFYITNGQPYGQRLEYGWSKTQAPYGIIRVTIASLR